MLTALAFILVNGASYTMALARGPFWGLLAYANIYFNSPNPDINWWAGYLPFERWALLTSAILLVSVAVHWSNLSDRKLGSAKWAYVFFIVSLIVTMTLAVNQDNANRLQYMLFTYCLITSIPLPAKQESYFCCYIYFYQVFITAFPNLFVTFTFTRSL